MSKRIRPESDLPDRCLPDLEPLSEIELQESSRKEILREHFREEVSRLLAVSDSRPRPGGGQPAEAVPDEELRSQLSRVLGERESDSEGV